MISFHHATERDLRCRPRESLTSAISPNGLDQACIRPCTHKSNFVAAVGPCPLCLPEADIRQPH